MATWKAVADSASQISQRSIAKRGNGRFRPKKQSSQKSQLFASLIQNTKSRVNSSMLQENQKRGNSFSKDLTLSKRQLKNSSSQIQLTSLRNKLIDKSQIKNLDPVNSVFPHQQLEKLKREFSSFQHMIMEELKKQQKLIQNFMKTIVNKLNIDQSDVLPAFNLNLRLEKYDVMGCLEERKYSSPIKKCVESTRIGSTTEKTPNSKSFHRFFEAMEKLKNDMKGLSEISLVKEKVNRIGLKHVKSDKILKL